MLLGARRATRLAPTKGYVRNGCITSSIWFDDSNSKVWLRPRRSPTSEGRILCVPARPGSLGFLRCETIWMSTLDCLTPKHCVPNNRMPLTKTSRQAVPSCIWYMSSSTPSEHHSHHSHHRRRYPSDGNQHNHHHQHRTCLGKKPCATRKTRCCTHAHKPSLLHPGSCLKYCSETPKPRDSGIYLHHIRVLRFFL